MEGAIRLEHLGDPPYFVALGVYQTADSGGLVTQSPMAESPDANISAAELHTLGSAINPCGEAEPVTSWWGIY
jgi:hypothetical protein